MIERNLEQRVAELEAQVQNLESMLKKFAYHEMSLMNRTACEDIFTLSQIFDVPLPTKGYTFNIPDFSKKEHSP